MPAPGPPKMMKPVVLVTGAAGLIGRYLVNRAGHWAPQWEVRGLTRADLDLTDGSNVEAAWHSIHPAAVIHCAALSRTHECHQNPDLARRVNVESTTLLAGLSKDIPFFFLSSGDVFDGRASWYGETDEPVPLNVYGETKWEAEQIILGNPLHTVVRLVLTAGTSPDRDRGFVEEMCRVARTGQEITLYADEFRCPLPAGVIARALWELLDRNQPGLYHLGGSERHSRWDIGQTLVPWYPELNGRLVKSSARNHRGGPRPADLSLRCDKLQRLLSFPLPGFQRWLAGRSERGPDLWDYPESCT
jgi:dTDP-4-dehydrorhamnose reductase